MERNLGCDIYCDATGKRWSCEITEHPQKGGEGVVVFEKHGMKPEWNATTAMESAYRRLQREQP